MGDWGLSGHQPRLCLLGVQLSRRVTDHCRIQHGTAQLLNAHPLLGPHKPNCYPWH